MTKALAEILRWAALVIIFLPATVTQAAVIGDCDDSGETNIVELQLCINIFLGETSLEACEFCSIDGEEVGIVDLQAAVNCFLDSTDSSCPMSAAGAATPTATAPPPTQTPTPSPDSTCGDGLLSGSETCESCPADCAVGPCTVATPAPTVTFRVNWSPPFGVDASSTTVLVAYKSTLVSLPGSGSMPASRVTLRPPNSIVAVNDLDYALRVVITRSGAITPGRIFHVNFDRCGGVAAPTPGDFACTVEGCASSFGDVAGCTCQVVIP